MASSKVVGNIFLAIDEFLWVEELAIKTSPHFINNSGLKIHEDSTRDVIPSTSFIKKGVKSIITSTDSLVTWHLAIKLDPMLEVVKLPTGISDLNTGLTDVH